jgi:hypothetical protein
MGRGPLNRPELRGCAVRCTDRPGRCIAAPLFYQISQSGQVYGECDNGDVLWGAPEAGRSDEKTNHSRLIQKNYTNFCKLRRDLQLIDESASKQSKHITQQAVRRRRCPRHYCFHQGQPVNGDWNVCMQRTQGCSSWAWPILFVRYLLWAESSSWSVISHILHGNLLRFKIQISKKVKISKCSK